jgi:hypothetical protein
MQPEAQRSAGRVQPHLILVGKAAPCRFQLDAHEAEQAQAQPVPHEPVRDQAALVSPFGGELEPQVVGPTHVFRLQQERVGGRGQRDDEEHRQQEPLPHFSDPPFGTDARTARAV